MKTKLNGQLAVAFIGLILGLMLAAQFKSVQRVGGNVSYARERDIQGQIQRLDMENEALKNRIAELLETVSEYEDAGKSSTDQFNKYRIELEKANALAGLTSLEGPGVVVTVNNMYISNDEDGVEVIQNVHHTDLMKIINELNAAGAEAISINRERIIATTEIRNAGDYIVINTNRNSVPFEIRAIGNPDTLFSSLNLLGGVIDSLSGILDIKIKREESVQVPAYSSPIQYNYAKPIEKE